MDFVREQLDDSGYQLSKVFEGISGEQWGAKVTDESMSPRETVAHLCECYVAVQAGLEGQEHSWGTYTIPEMSDDALPTFLAESRQKAVNAIVSSSNPKAPSLASAYVTLHDAYHVGQLVTLRLGFGGFDPYSIYNHG